MGKKQTINDEVNSALEDHEAIQQEEPRPTTLCAYYRRFLNAPIRDKKARRLIKRWKTGTFNINHTFREERGRR